MRETSPHRLRVKPCRNMKIVFGTLPALSSCFFLMYSNFQGCISIRSSSRLTLIHDGAVRNCLRLMTHFKISPLSHFGAHEV
jgi:hypothetical protein